MIIADRLKSIEEIAPEDDTDETDKEIFRALEFQKADEVNTVAVFDLSPGD